MRDRVSPGVLLPALLLPAVLLAGAGCATKGWVQERFGKQQVEFDERFTKVEGRVTESGRRLDEVQDQVGQSSQRLGGVEARVTEQSQRVDTLTGTVGETTTLARNAGERADAARARADEVDGRLTRLWKNREARSLVETVAVHFAFGRADLDDGAQTSLVGLAREMKDDPRLTVELEGYTDTRGTLDYNLRLSQRRVEAVRRYLVRQGIELRRIHAAGLGPLDEAGLTPQEKRRVTVKLTTPVE